MNFERFIARRYLFSGQHKALVSVITLISIFGVAIGVFALIVVLAVMEGFGQNLRDKVIGAYSHLEIARATALSPPIETTGMLERLRGIPEVKSAAPVILKMGLVQVRDASGQTRQTGAYIQGIDFELEPSVTTVMSNVNGNAKPGPNEIVLGKGVAEQLMAQPGARLLVVTPVFAETANGRVPVLRNVDLAGIFNTGFPETDQIIAYMDISAARDMFLMPEGMVDAMRIMVHNPDRIFDIQRSVQANLGPDFRVTTWVDRNPLLFDALRLEKWAMFIILLLIVMVAATNIIGSLVMVVMEKTREIGILKSMGATREAIQRIFVIQGMLIGGTGTAVGGTLGLLVCYLLKYHIKINALSEAYLSDRIPMVIDMGTNALIIASALIICFFASLYPARQAAKLDPVEALRYE